jgi:predicted small metal-binding protein
MCPITRVQLATQIVAAADLEERAAMHVAYNIATIEERMENQVETEVLDSVKGHMKTMCEHIKDEMGQDMLNKIVESKLTDAQLAEIVTFIGSSAYREVKHLMTDTAEMIHTIGTYFQKFQQQAEQTLGLEESE